MSTIEELC